MKDLETRLPLLRMIQSANGPVGASTLCVNPALKMSQATVGRQLARLEREGYLKKISNKGRVLTTKGYDYISHAVDNSNKTRIAEELISLSTSNDLELLLQIIDLRLMLEPYAAGRAAIYATEDEIQTIEDLVFVHRYRLSQGEAAHREDLELHLSIAKFCRNAMLQKILELLLTENNAYVEFSLAGGSQREQQIQYHFRILEAIRAHNSTAAEQAMREHLSHVSSDVKRYYASEA